MKTSEMMKIYEDLKARSEGKKEEIKELERELKPYGFLKEKENTPQLQENLALMQEALVHLESAQRDLLKVIQIKTQREMKMYT